jgi:cation diffusion facilitator family transporter
MGALHSHDHADRLDTALRDSAAGIRAVKISLAVLGVTAVAQLVIVAVSGSVALFADTVHNFSDALTAVPLWIAFSMSRRAATRRYTYGFGRVEDLAGLFVVAVIAISALVAVVESIRRLVDPVPLTHLGWVAAAGVVGFIGNEVVALYRIRVGKRIGSAALRADGMHARADGLTSLAVVAGAVGAALGFPAADPIVGLVIALAIGAVLVVAARDVFGRLLDRIDPELVDSAHSVLADQPSVRAVRRVRMRWVGHQLEADAELDVDPTLTLADAHRVAHDAEHELAHAIPKLGSVVVHAYPTHAPAFSSRTSHQSADPAPLPSGSRTDRRRHFRTVRPTGGRS